MTTVPAFLSERELAYRWRVSTRLIRQMRTDRKLDHVRFGRRVVYPVAAIELYEREQLVLAKSVTVPFKRRAR